MSVLFSCCASLKTEPLFCTSKVNDMFSGCKSLNDINPYKFKDCDFSKLNSPYLREKYPELYI